MLEIDDSALAKENANRKDQLDSMLEEDKRQDEVRLYSVQRIRLSCYLFSSTAIAFVSEQLLKFPHLAVSRH